jgi:hypothetical protein
LRRERWRVALRRDRFRSHAALFGPASFLVAAFETTPPEAKAASPSYFNRKGRAMASTRSTPSTRRAASAASSDTPKGALTALARHGARIQIAACTAAAKTLNEWAQTADRFAQAVGDELLRRVNGESDSSELVARITTASSTHLRELTALPRAAADHFDTRLARVPIDD